MKNDKNATKNVYIKTIETSSFFSGYSYIFLHFLLPIAGVIVLWERRSIFSKLMLQLDRSCLAVYCPSFSKREQLLRWASTRLPKSWSSSSAKTLAGGILELWKDGSLLCTLINSVIPGACPNPHRHWRKPPLHAQALAYKYLGLIPIFTDGDFKCEMTIIQEKNFLDYLRRLQETITKWHSNDYLSYTFSLQYIARGMGLSTGLQNSKTVFYIYANAAVKKRSNVLMLIRGPFGSEGKTTISPFHNLKRIPIVNVLQEQLEATKTVPFKSKNQKSFLKTISLDFTSLIGNEDKNDNCNNIEIQIEMELDRAKVTYIPNSTGIYEINLICEGELLQGCPYLVQIDKNTSGICETLKNKNEHVEEKISYKKRKVLSRVIDCIDKEISIIPEENLDVKHDLTITAITKKQDEILQTEFDCILKDESKEHDSLEIIAEELLQEKTDIFSTRINPEQIIVQDFKEIKAEILNLIHDEVDHTKEDKTDLSVTPIRRVKTKMQIELSPKASPICVRHIVPEDKKPLSQLSLVEKRQTLSKQNAVEQTPNPDNSFEKSFREKKEYWEKMSSRSSSPVSLSLENIAENRVNKTKHSKSESTNQSSTKSNLMSIADRKTELLKNLYQTKNHSQSYNKKLNVEKTQVDLDSNKNEENIIKTKFKKAVNFFKKLEKKTTADNNNNKLLKIRRLSLDYQKKKTRKVRGGSLNLSNVPDRFFINNLYSDVSSRNNGSFKGAPNRNNIAKSLASLNDSNHTNNMENSNDTINYKLFIPAKTKKRKSIFNINFY